MFDDDATEYDPNPWGARQRVIPRDTFRVAPLPMPAAAPALAFAAPPITLRLPTLPTLPIILPARHRRWLARFAIPLCGVAALLCLAIAYALKPATLASAPAAALAMPVVEEPAMQIEATAVEPPAPAPIAVKAAVAVAKPRVKAKRRAIKIDASITSTPLGHLRPSRR